jgi:hypothetical protein
VYELVAGEVLIVTALDQKWAPTGMKGARMMKKYIAFAVILLTNACRTQPTSYEELAKAYRSAHESESVADMDRLIWWGPSSPAEKESFLNDIYKTFGATITRIEVTPPPTDVRIPRNDGFVFPVSPEKSLRVEYKQEGKPGTMALNGMTLNIAKKEGHAWIVIPVNSEHYKR